MQNNFKPRLQYDLIGDIAGGDTSVGVAATASGSSLVPAIASGSGLIGGIIDAFTASSRQRKAQDFAVQQANQQRQWALQDRDFANAYNAPAAQMARYKAAGLNPNLIYGTNTQPSQPVRSTAPAEPRVAPATLGKSISDAAQNYIGTKLQAGQLAIQAGQVGVLDAQRQDLLASARQKSEGNLPLLQIETDQRKLQYRIDSAAADASIALKQGQPLLQQAEITKLLTDSQVEQAKLQPSLNLMVAETIRAYASTEVDMTRKINLLKEAQILEQDTRLKTMEANYMQKYGTHMPTPGGLWGLAQTVLNKLFTSVPGNTPLPKDINPQTGEPSTPYRNPMDPAP